MCKETTEQMTQMVKPYLTPISSVLSEEHGEHWGTGNFVEIGGERYIVSNEHVAAKMLATPLGFGFHDGEDIARLSGNAVNYAYPIDAAVWKVPSLAWESAGPHGAKAVQLSQFASAHTAVDNEMMFVAGFSGERSTFTHGHLFTSATPLLTVEQSDEFPEEGNRYFHFALVYSPEKVTSLAERGQPLPLPKGLSGSFVWNTRRIEHLRQGRIWTPQAARVTGIVWGWPTSSACILATKIEHLEIREMARVAASSATAGPSTS